MQKFQTFLKHTREAKSLEYKTVADATNLSIETIKIIELSDKDILLQTSNTLLKNQVRRYCEYLEIPEKKIVSILNKIDILHYKKSRYGKLKIFDYINRIVILIVAIMIIIMAVEMVKNKISNIDNTPDPQSSKSTIIYTPITYTTDSDTSKVNEQTNTEDKTINNSVKVNNEVKENQDDKSEVVAPEVNTNITNADIKKNSNSEMSDEDIMNIPQG